MLCSFKQSINLIKFKTTVVIRRNRSATTTTTTAAATTTKITRKIRDFEEIPSAKGLPLIGTTLSLLLSGSSSNLHNYIDKRHNEFGVILKEKLGPVSAVFLSEPNEIRKVFLNEGKYPLHLLPESWMVYNQIHGCLRGLFFMDGEEWLYHRKIMNQLLLKGNLTWIDDCCEFIANRLINEEIFLNHSNTENYLEDNFYKCSLDVILCVVLGVETYKQNYKQFDELSMKLSIIVQNIFKTSSKLQLIPAKFASKFKLKIWRDFENSVTEALNSTKLLTKELIEMCTTNPNNDGLLNKLLNEKITNDNINRIIIDFILAAGDTTAYAMEWILYLLSKNPSIQNELRESIKSNQQQSLLKNIMRETLRLYPVAPFLTRITTQNTIISNYNIPIGTIIVLSIFSTGHNPNFFPKPDVFNPSRWNRDNIDFNANQQLATLPFAIGARSCIGRKIAEAQLQIILSKIIENYRIELLNRNEIKMILRMVSVPSEPIKLKFHSIS